MSKLVNATLAATLLGTLVGCDPNSGMPLQAPGRPDAGSSADASDAEIPTKPDLAADPSTRFLGEWRYASGAASLQCVAAPPAPLSVTGYVRFLPGASGDQVIVVDDQGCQIPGSVDGNVVVAPSGSTCPREGITYSSLIYTITDATLREQVSAQVTFPDANCHLEGDSLLTRD